MIKAEIKGPKKRSPFGGRLSFGCVGAPAARFAWVVLFLSVSAGLSAAAYHLVLGAGLPVALRFFLLVGVAAFILLACFFCLVVLRARSMGARLDVCVGRVRDCEHQEQVAAREIEDVGASGLVRGREDLAVQSGRWAW